MKSIKIIGNGVVGMFIAYFLNLSKIAVTIYGDSNRRFSAGPNALGIVEHQGVQGSDSGIITTEMMTTFNQETPEEWRTWSHHPETKHLVRSGNFDYFYKEESKDTSFIHDNPESFKSSEKGTEEISENHRKAGYKVGASMFAVILNPHGLIEWMENKLRERGVDFVDGVVSENQILEMENQGNIVLRATGCGRKVYFNLDDIVPIKGETLTFQGPHGMKSGMGAPGGKGSSVNINIIDDQTIRVGSSRVEGCLDEKRDLSYELEAKETVEELKPGLLARMTHVNTTPGFRPTRKKLLFNRKVLPNGGITYTINGLGGSGWSVIWGLARYSASLIAKDYRKFVKTV